MPASEPAQEENILQDAVLPNGASPPVCTSFLRPWATQTCVHLRQMTRHRAVTNAARRLAQPQTQPSLHTHAPPSHARTLTLTHTHTHTHTHTPGGTS